MFSHWTQMEGFIMSPLEEPLNETIHYNFTNISMNLKFLKIFNVENTNIGKIDESIGYLLPKLTIFSIWYVLYYFHSLFFCLCFYLCVVHVLLADLVGFFCVYLLMFLVINYTQQAS